MKLTLLLGLLFIVRFSYGQQAVNVNFNHDGKIVYGTFTKPAGPGVFPVIIINPGSGANDRHGTIQMAGANVSCLYPALLNTTLRPYQHLSDALVAAGYAVLRYDKLEYTYSGASLGPVTFQKLWLPVESAINYVKTRPDVDVNQIILIGHSEGSSLIPYIAKKRTDVKALISIAGPRTPFDSLLAYQIMHITQTCGGNVSQAQADANQILNYFSSIRNNTWNASTPALFGVPAGTWADYTRITDSVAINYNQANLPTLFTGLQLDINVPPAELTRFQNETTIGADFYSMPGLIHYMTPNNSPIVSAALTDTIIYWLGQRVLMGVKKDKLPEETVKLFPNPATDQIKLQSEKLLTGSLTLSNLQGQKVWQETVSKITEKIIPLQSLSSGIYILQFQSENGSFFSKKVVKQ